MKLQERRKECCIDQDDLARRVGTTAPMMSNFERYKCIPIPEMLNAICKELNCDIEDIYDRCEIYIDSKPRCLNKEISAYARQEPEIYKLSVRLPEIARKIFTRENLEMCGYHSLKDFIWHCYKRFEKQIQIINKKATKHPNCSMENEIEM